MDKEEFRAERLYLMSLSVAKAMLQKNIISEEEFTQADMVLMEKYRPTLAILLSGKPLT